MLHKQLDSESLFGWNWVTGLRGCFHVCVSDYHAHRDFLSIVLRNYNE